MINARTALRFQDKLPKATDVVVIGGGVIGVFASLYLRRLGKQVTLCEKGVVAGEQSSRNWGWVRCMNRDPAELPLAMEAQRLWKAVDEEVDGETGLTQEGIHYLCESEDEMSKWNFWLDIARQHGLDSHFVSGKEVSKRIPAHANEFAGALYTPTDCRAEPWAAVPAVAKLAHAEGVVLREQCAVRALEITGGKVNGVVTEAGTIAAEQVVLAGGAWSSMLARLHGINLPQLVVRGTVAATGTLPEAFGGQIKDKEIAIRRRKDGGYTLALPNTHHFVGPDSFRLAADYLPLLSTMPDVTLKPPAFTHPNSWSVKRSWSEEETSPFEDTRVLDPPPDDRTVQKLQTLFAARFPDLGQPRVAASWAGMIDAMPDVVPIVDRVPSLEGLIVATGMSGHGFGIGPAFGKAIAHIAHGLDVGHDMRRFRSERFADGSAVEPGPGL